MGAEPVRTVVVEVVAGEFDRDEVEVKILFKIEIEFVFFANDRICSRLLRQRVEMRLHLSWASRLNSSKSMGFETVVGFVETNAS